MYTDDLIDEKTKEYLIQPDVKPGRFYVLPKVHKPCNPGRPIVSSNSHPTERISHFIIWLCLTRTGNYKIHQFD